MKSCPDCGEARDKGMRFCPVCGQRLIDSKLDGKPRRIHQPEVAPKGANWFQRHPGWTLLFVILCTPFVLWTILFAIVMLALLFPRDLGDAIVRGTMSAAPIMYIVILVFAVRWYKAKKRQSRAMADYKKAIELNPKDPDAYYKRGDAYAELGEYAKAIADYSKVIELDHRHPVAFFNRAYAYGETGDYDMAIADYSKAIELAPADAQAYYNRGLDYLNKGEVPQTVSDLEKAVELSADAELTEDAQKALCRLRSAS